MKNNRNYYLLLLALASLLSACCKGKNDYNSEITADDWEWFMTGEKQLAIYRDSATGQQDTLRYNAIETALADCEKVNAGTWLNTCYVMSCKKDAKQYLTFHEESKFKRVERVSYLGAQASLTYNGESLPYKPDFAYKEKVNGQEENGMYLYFANAILPEPYELFVNKAKGVLIYRYRDANGTKYKWEKIN